MLHAHLSELPWSQCQRVLVFTLKKRETEAKSPTGATLIKLNKRFHCNSKFILYLITCPVCSKQYVCKTETAEQEWTTIRRTSEIRKKRTCIVTNISKNCIIRKYGEFRKPFFFCKPFLYVKDPTKRHTLEQTCIKNSNQSSTNNESTTPKSLDLQSI